MLKNRNGAIDVLFLAALVLVTLATMFTLWRVEEADRQVSKSEASTETVTTPKQKTQKESTEEPMVPVGYLLYESEALGISFEYPEDWFVDRKDCAPNLIGLGSTEENARILCQSDKPMEIAIAPTEQTFEDSACENYETETDFETDRTCEINTINDSTAQVTSAVTTGEGLYTEDTQLMRYLIRRDNGTNLSVSYTELNPETDQSVIQELVESLQFTD